MELDARGKACPQPVVLALRALAQRKPGETLYVLVDNEAAVENLKRMAAHKDCPCTVSRREGCWTVAIGGGADAAAPEQEDGARPAALCGGAAVVAVGTDQMGRGSEELGRTLLKGFLYALAQLETPPETVLFFNGGAKLTAQGSQSLDDLRELESRGAQILTCGTCLDYYGLKDQLAVGSVTNMYQIAQLLTQAGRLVSL